MMEEIGPDMAEIEAVIQSEDKNWAIQFEDQSIIMLEWAERPDRVVLSSMLGIPSVAMQLSVYEALLCYNLLWKDMLNAINNINSINRLFSEAKDNQVIRAEDIGGNTSVNVRFYSRKNISDQIWQKLTDWTKGAKNKQALAKKTIINNLNVGDKFTLTNIMNVSNKYLAFGDLSYDNQVYDNHNNIIQQPLLIKFFKGKKYAEISINPNIYFPTSTDLNKAVNFSVIYKYFDTTKATVTIQGVRGVNFKNITSADQYIGFVNPSSNCFTTWVGIFQNKWFVSIDIFRKP